MPWDAKEFADKHNKALKDKPKKAAKAARQATAMIEAGVPEGEAIATANKQAKRKHKETKTTKTGHKTGEKPKKKKRGDGLKQFAERLQTRFR